MSRFLTIALAATALTAAAAPAQATLIGDSVTFEIRDGASSFGAQTVTVGAGEEGNYFGNQFFDFGADSFSIRSTNEFCGFSCGNNTIRFLLTSLDLGAPITGVTLSTSLAGVATSFTANSVTFSFTDQFLPANSYLSATFQTGGTGAVPEPATWGLMLLGFGLVGAALRRRTPAAAIAA